MTEERKKLETVVSEDFGFEGAQVVQVGNDLFVYKYGEIEHFYMIFGLLSDNIYFQEVA